MKVTFLGQGLESKSEDAIGYYLINYLSSNNFHSFTAISAFASKFAIEGLAKYIKLAKESFGKLTIIVGIDQEGTSKEALEEIRDLNIDSYIFYQSEAVIFHSKIYLFEGDNEVKLIIGSSNLTGTGLFRNVESSVLIEFAAIDKEGEKLLADLKNYYKTLLDFTDRNLFKITTDIIEKFSMIGILPKESIRREKYSKKTDSLNNGTILNIDERQTARIPYFFFKNETVDGDLNLRLNKAKPEVQDLFYNLERKVYAINRNIKRKITNSYIAFELSKNFIELHVQKNRLMLYLRPGEYDNTNITSDKIPDTYQWSLNQRVYIENSRDIDYVMPLIEQSYRDVL